MMIVMAAIMRVMNQASEGGKPRQALQSSRSKAAARRALVILIRPSMTSQLSWNHYHRWSKLRDSNLHASLQDPATTTGGGRKQRAISSASDIH